MVQIKNREDVKLFINSLPKTRRVDVASALASRAALRVLPFVINVSQKRREQLILTSLRAILTSGARFSCAAPEVREDLRANAAAAAASAANAAASTYASAANAAASAASAAYAAASVSYKTVQRDAERLMVDIPNGFAAPLWTDAELTANPRFQAAYDDLLAFFDTAPETWSFGRRWYVALWNGTPMDWDLPTQVALIDDEHWKKGAAHIAAEVAKVEARMGPLRPDHVPQLEKTKLRTHVQQLLQHPLTSEEVAVAAAVQLDQMIQDYKTNAPANKLPDGMEALEEIPAHFRRIAVVFKCGADQAAKIESLEAEITALNNRVAQLEGELAAALSKTLNGRFGCAVVDSFGKYVGNGVLPGALCIAVAHFFGVVPSDLTLSNLRDYIESFKGAAPLDIRGSLPPSTDA